MTIKMKLRKQASEDVNNQLAELAEDIRVKPMMNYRLLGWSEIN